jgi:hypothetical protein
MATWSEHLDDFEATIVRLEAALASGEEPVVTPWLAPDTAPAGLPTRHHHARLRELQARSDACAVQLRAALTDATADLDSLRRTGAAARAYGRVDDLAPR